MNRPDSLVTKPILRKSVAIVLLALLTHLVVE